MVDEVKPLYKVGDKLRVLVDNPWMAGVVKGDLIVITGVREPFGNDPVIHSYDISSEKHGNWGINDDMHDIYVEFYHEPNDIQWWLDNRSISTGVIE